MRKLSFIVIVISAVFLLSAIYTNSQEKFYYGFDHKIAKFVIPKKMLYLYSNLENIFFINKLKRYI